MNLKASESIWNGSYVIVPMAEVSHIERDMRPEYKGSITIVFKHSNWQADINSHIPCVYLDVDEAVKFLKDWCYYRAEIESTELNINL